MNGTLKKKIEESSSSSSSNSGSKDSSASNSPNKTVGEGHAAHVLNAVSKSDSVLSQQLQQAIEDFTVACAIEPENAALKTDLEKLESLKEKVAAAEEQDDWVLVQ